MLASRRFFWIIPLLILITVGLWTAATGQLLTAPGDSVLQHLPARAFSGRTYLAGRLPLWNPYEASGVPHAALVQPGVFYPFNVLLYCAFPPLIAFNLSVVLHFILLVYFTYKFLATILASQRGVLLGTVSFCLCAFMAIHSGLIPVSNAVVWIPALFYCAEKWIQTSNLKYCVWGGACIALTLLAGWAQFVLLCSVYLLIYALLAIPRVANRRRFLSGLCLLFVTSALLVLPQSVLTLDFKQHTSLRSLDWALFRTPSYPPQLLPIQLFFPRFFRANHAINEVGLWWGPLDGAIAAIYIGILPLMLSAAALSRWKESRTVRFAAISLIVSALLGFGAYTPIGKLLFYTPFFNFFHDHWTNFIFFDFCIAILAAQGVGSLDFDKLPDKTKRRLAAIISLAFLALATATLIKSRWLLRSLNPQISRLPADWLSHLHATVKFNNSDITIPVGLIVASGLFFWFWTRHPKSVSMYAAAVGIVALDLAFYGVFAQDWIISGSLSSQSQALVTTIKQNADGKDFRVYSPQPGDIMLRVNANTLYGYADIMGYEPFLTYPYANLLELTTGGGSPRWRELLFNNRILSLLNVRYVIADGEHRRALEKLLTTAAAKLPAEESSVNLLSDLGWQPYDQVLSMGSVSSFKSDGIHPHGVLQSAKLHGQTVYQLSYQGRGDYGERWDLLGIVAEGDHAEYCGIPPSLLTDQYEPNVCLHFESEIQSQPAFIEFLTLSKTPLYLRNVKLVAIGSLPRPNSPYHVAAAAGDLTLFENQNVLPRAYFVKAVRSVSSYQEAKFQLWDMTNGLDLATTALVESDKDKLPSNVDAGTVDLVRYSPNQVNLQVRCSGSCFMVLSDPYFPGWRALMDGKDTPVYRTDGVVRGVLVPTGSHKLEFHYRPPWFGWGIAAGILGLLLLGCFSLPWSSLERDS